VIGVDMTPEQLEVAVRHRDWHAERFGYANVEFLHGHIENLAAIGIDDNSIDVVVSNCVINLSPEKPRVLAEIFRVLKPGGELYFSDVFADRRIPPALRQDPVLLGECLGGALYWEDFRRILQALDCPDVRVVKQNSISLDDPDVAAKIGMVKFQSVTVRAFKLAAGRPLRGLRPGGLLSRQHPGTSSRLRPGRPSSFRNRPTATGVRQHRRHAGRQPLCRTFSGIGRSIPSLRLVRLHAGAAGRIGGIRRFVLLIGSVAMTDTLLTEQTLAAQRPVLFRYALLQLRDSELADDAVQETLLAAWQSAAGFEGKAGLRTWLIGILKHKIADHWRRSAREAVAPIFDRTDEDDGEAEVDDYFMSSGHWNGGPRSGPIPKRH